jgi:hypothetical protein
VTVDLSDESGYDKLHLSGKIKKDDVNALTGSSSHIDMISAADITLFGETVSTITESLPIDISGFEVFTDRLEKQADGHDRLRRDQHRAPAVIRLHAGRHRQKRQADGQPVLHRHRDGHPSFQFIAPGGRDLDRQPCDQGRFRVRRHLQRDSAQTWSPRARPSMSAAS